MALFLFFHYEFHDVSLSSMMIVILLSNRKDGIRGGVVEEDQIAFK